MCPIYITVFYRRVHNVKRFIYFKKRAIRNIEAPYRAHTEPIFKSVILIKIEDMYHLAILKFY